jgi:hypothetical protein
VFCLKEKNLNSYCSSEGRSRSDKKSFLAAKKMAKRV